MMMRKLLANQVTKLVILLLPFALQVCTERVASQIHQQPPKTDDVQTTVRTVNEQPEHSVTGFTTTNVGELLTIITDDRLREENPDRVARAMYRLGELHAVEAIDDLIQLLTFRRSFESDVTRVTTRLIGPTDRYPAIGALYGIGEPSLSALIGVVEQHETGSLARENALYTLRLIHREDPMREVEFLRAAAVRATSPEATRRLSEAAQRAEEHVHQQTTLLVNPQPATGAVRPTGVEELLVMIRDERLREEDPERVARAMYRLGELRAVGAIDDLVRLLTFSRTFQPGDPLGDNTFHRYPSAGALVVIGEPALLSLVRVIEEHESGSLASDNAIYAIQTIHINKRQSGQESRYLREAAARASSPEAARRLSVAARRVDLPFAPR